MTVNKQVKCEVKVINKKTLYIHSFLFLFFSAPIQGHGVLEPILAKTGQEAVYNLDRLPVCCRANTDTIHTHIHTFG